VGAAGGPEQIAEVAAIMSIAVGLVCLVGYIARLGFLTRLLSRPVLVGYLIGIAVLMIISQLSEMTKIDTDGVQACYEVVSLFQHVTYEHMPTLLRTEAVLVLSYVAHWVPPKFPAPLMALLLAAGAVAIFHLNRFCLVVIHEEPRGLPATRL